MMKAILITEEQFKKMTIAAINEYIAKMKKVAHDGEKNYSALMEFGDRLTLTLVFGLMAGKLFDKGGECDE